MPVPGIGGVGDIIAVANLAVKLAKALDDTRGSAREYRDVVQSLYGVEKSLLELDALCGSLDKTASYSQLGEDIQQEVQNCKAMIEEYKKRIQKYDKALKEDGSGNKMKDAYYKVRWQIAQKESVAEMAKCLQTRVVSINLLTTTLKLAKTGVDEKTLCARLEEIGRKIGEVQHNDLLSSLKSEIARNNGLIERQVQSQRWFNLTNVQKFGSDLFDKLRAIAMVGQETLREVKWISSQIPRPVPAWSEHQVLLDDAFRQVVPIPIDFITSWESFDQLMNNRFANFPGLNLVKQRDYILEDEDFKQRFNRWQPWTEAFRPGRTLKMSMVLNGTTAPRQACPSCGAEDKGVSDERIECTSCGLQYQRVMQDIDIPIRHGFEERRDEIRYKYGKGTFRYPDPSRAPLMNPLKRKLWESDPEDDNSIRKLRRVYLVSTENTKVPANEFQLKTLLGQSTQKNPVFANCLCGLDKAGIDAEDSIQCELCGMYQHLQCHGLQYPLYTQWRCLRCHFIVQGQREWGQRGADCPFKTCSLSWIDRRYIEGYEGQLAHFLSHDDVEVVCTFCAPQVAEKLPKFTHARVYRTHLALIHGANVLKDTLPRLLSSKMLVLRSAEPDLEHVIAACSLCDQELSSFAKAADHVEICAVRTIIERGYRSNIFTSPSSVTEIDDYNYREDHDVLRFSKVRYLAFGDMGTKAAKSLAHLSSGEERCRGGLTQDWCLAGCFGAPKGQTKMSDRKFW
ncbi:MAG: hypothetical protein M1821_009391 [Bathelium mastoideum]|nr:MAG: hypothetical protein M1821_009391 [Bathelium mastoideum]